MILVTGPTCANGLGGISHRSKEYGGVSRNVPERKFGHWRGIKHKVMDSAAHYHTFVKVLLFKEHWSLQFHVVLAAHVCSLGVKDMP